jgi:hypothetical protein
MASAESEASQAQQSVAATTSDSNATSNTEERAAKRLKMDNAAVTQENGTSHEQVAPVDGTIPSAPNNGKVEEAPASTDAPTRRGGTAPIKKEYDYFLL